MIFILQVLVSVLFLAQKAFVLFGKKLGWWLGVIAAALGVMYFTLLGLYIYVVLDIGLIVLMSHRGLTPEGVQHPKTEMAIRVVTGAAMSIMALIVFNGVMTAVEFVSAAAMLPGTYFLARSRKRLGWFLNAITHATGVYLLYWMDQPILLVCQVISLILSLIGIFVPVIHLKKAR